MEIAQATDGGAFQTIVQHEYDERTNLSTKKLHNTTGSSYLYELDYTYNIRGWLEQINTFDDPGMIFAMQLHYGEGDEDLSSAYEDGDDANYNGNITMLEWQVGENGDRATYGLLYDPLNRLDGAVYGFYEPPYGYNRNYRYELSVDYDQNGNITDFWRRGETGSPGSELFSVIDNMDYTYDSEGKLSSVYENSSTTYGFNGSGATANYTYDNNGNLISDANRGISSVDYNHLNLPTKVTYSGGQWIEWTYDALGTKLQKSTSTGDDRYYEGDIEYQNTSLAVIYHEEGFLQPDGSSGFDYFYYLRDHLGNTRLIVQDANSNGSLDTTEIVQENHYYPFGMQMQGDWMGSSVDNYTYNGKEWNGDFGLDWLDYGARWYDPSIGRWNAVDPLAESYYPISPYAYVANNPLVFIDPDGMRIIWGDDEASQDYKKEVLQMTENSKLFAAVYNFLDGLSTDINVSVDDKKVQERYQAATKGDDPDGRAGGLTTPDGQTIILSDKHGDPTTNASEEFFHSFQILGEYSEEPRTRQELDAEAKLFNASILQELSPTGSSKVGAAKIIEDIENGATTGLMYKAGALVTTLLDAVESNSLIISKDSKAFKSYTGYLQAFQQGQKGPNNVYGGKQRLLVPAAYNRAVKLSNK